VREIGLLSQLKRVGVSFMDTARKDVKPCLCGAVGDSVLGSRIAATPNGYGVMCWACLKRTTLWTDEADAYKAWNELQGAAND